MDSRTVNSLITRVPTINKRPLAQTTTAIGSRIRLNFLTLTLLPIFYCFDQNGGLYALGFRGSTLERQFKMRPDYLTGRVFAAERQTLPTFKTLK
jgi:hypothetical protein